jgi:sugar phosphate isomerase/epimerase
MILGFVSAILPDLSLEEVANFASSVGFDCVELMCWPRGRAERRYAGVTHIDVTECSKARADKIRGVMKAAGVSISGLGYYPNLLTPDADESSICLHHLKTVIAAAPLLDVRTVNTFVGRDWSRTVADNWARFEGIWRPMVAFAEDHGVRIAIENCPMLFTRDEWPGGKNLAYSPAVWRRMFEAIPSKSFGLNYDPSHLVWQQIDYEKPLWEFSDRIFHVHAKDVRVDKSRLDDAGILATPLEYHTPKLPGMGEINWSRFISVLGDVGYRGPLCVEVEDRAYEGSLELRKAALRQSARYLRQFLPGTR